MIKLHCVVYLLLLGNQTRAVVNSGSTGFHHKSDRFRHTRVQNCLDDNKYNYQMTRYQTCAKEYFTNQLHNHGANDFETQLKYVLQRTCRNPDGIMKCIYPLAITLMSCLDTTPHYLLDYNLAIAATYTYVCSDEGQAFAELFANPEEATCFGKLPDVLADGECQLEHELQTVTQPLTREQNCKNTERFLNCLVKALRKRCDVHDLFNYIANYFHVIMQSGSCESHYSGMPHSGTSSLTSLKCTVAGLLITFKFLRFLN